MAAVALRPALVVVLGYAVLLLAVGLWAQRRIGSHEDFLVAGRRLPLALAAPTLLATWFGAGTLLTATDAVREGGLRMAALEPIGPGLCLLLAGLLLAGPLWRLELLTLGDFFARRFGPRAERVAAALMVPSYFGWIAAQYVALAGLLEIAFGLPASWGIALVAALGVAYTLLGGMWSVTVTDALQLALVVVGLAVLAFEVFAVLGEGAPAAGLARLGEELPADKLVLIPRESSEAALAWLGVLAVGALGNLPGQDLCQRIFAARDATTARRACYLAGAAYLALGALALALGLAAQLLVPDADTRSTLALLAQLFLSPTMAVIFALVVMSAVLSSLDSAILSPSSVLAQNLVWPLARRRLEARGLSLLTVNRGCVVVIGAAALVPAYLGESAYSLLEEAYAFGLVSLLVPLLFGVHGRRGDEAAALGSMAAGTGIWLVHRFAGSEAFLGRLWPSAWPALPIGVSAAGLAALVYALMARRRGRPTPTPVPPPSPTVAPPP